MLRSALLVGDSGLVEGSGSVHEEGTCRVQRIAVYPRGEVSADGTGVVSHVGSRLLADVAAAVGLPEVFDEAAGGHRRRCSAHAPGRVLTDLAVLLADGGEAISDLAVLRHQPGPVRAGGLDGDGVAGPGLRRRHRPGRAETSPGACAGTGLAAARRGGAARGG